MSQQTKRGVLTSLNLRQGQTKGNSPKKQTVITSQYTLGTHPPIVNRLPAHSNLTVQELTGTRFANSVSYHHQKPQIHVSYGQGVSSNFVPPPPERFFVSNSTVHSPPSHLPINSNSHHQVHRVHNVQPMSQSIKRTYVPHHIYNEIPVMASSTKQYEQQIEEQGLNEADERMLEQYEKLYGNYMEEKARNQHLQRQIKQYELRINQRQTSPTRVQEVTKIVNVTKPMKIDVQMLAQLIARKSQGLISEIVERRKRNCLSNIQSLFANQQSSIKTTIIRSSEEIVRVRSR